MWSKCEGKPLNYFEKPHLANSQYKTTTTTDKNIHTHTYLQYVFIWAFAFAQKTPSGAALATAVAVCLLSATPATGNEVRLHKASHSLKYSHNELKSWPKKIVCKVAAIMISLTSDCCRMTIIAWVVVVAAVCSAATNAATAVFLTEVFALFQMLRSLCTYVCMYLCLCVCACVCVS